jgi:hypothetical protein
MFDLYMILFTAVLFYALTPGVLLRLPQGGSKMAVAATHAVVFALVYQVTHKMVSKFIGREGFEASGSPSPSPSPSPASEKKGMQGMQNMRM